MQPPERVRHVFAEGSALTHVRDARADQDHGEGARVRGCPSLACLLVLLHDCLVDYPKRAVPDDPLICEHPFGGVARVVRARSHSSWVGCTRHQISGSAAQQTLVSGKGVTTDCGRRLTYLHSVYAFVDGRRGHPSTACSRRNYAGVPTAHCQRKTFAFSEEQKGRKFFPW